MSERVPDPSDMQFEESPVHREQGPETIERMALVFMACVGLAVGAAFPLAGMLAH